jgi:hypothetical protein
MAFFRFSGVGISLGGIANENGPKVGSALKLRAAVIGLSYYSI